MADKKVEVKVGVEVDDDEVKALEEQLSHLDGENEQVNVNVEDGELKSAEAEIEDIDGQEVTIEANLGMQNLMDGLSQAKAAISELKNNMSEAFSAYGQQETNETFLQMNIGASAAASKMQEINDIVANLPGDDTAIAGLLSSAAAKNASLTADEMTRMGTAAADYFSAMSYYGKSATEAQQDMTNYILAGNTAELERSPILQAHIDQLKEANTPLERTLALQQALKEEGWGGISTQDTYNNKLETFNGMLTRGQRNFAGMFAAGAMGAMDAALKLDETTNGIFGMSIAAIQVAGGPLVGLFSSIGQVATGLNALKGVKAALIPVEMAEGTAGWFSISWMLVAIAIGIALGLAFIYLYNNVDWFRQGVDNMVASLQWFVNYISTAVLGAVQWLMDSFNNFTSQLGLNTNDWGQAILGFILFVATMPVRIGTYLANTLAKALGFGNNFTNGLKTAAMNAVNGFMQYISSLPGKFYEELQKMLGYARDFLVQLPATLKNAAINVVRSWIFGTGEHSPGFMYDAFTGELSAMASAPKNYSPELSKGIQNMGVNMTNSFETGKLSLGGGATKIGGNITINMEIGSVDNEKRIQEIVDAVRRELAWNNSTAGRTV